jgi:hypothetical protein
VSERSTGIDDLGRAKRGSRLQLQIWVNRRQDELSRRLVNALPSLASVNPRLRWVSPLESDKFVEYQDTAFLRALELESLDPQLKRFWPRHGPVWDALAAVEIGSDPAPKGVVLVEAKSYPAEIYGDGCGATPGSRNKIERALGKTKDWLGVPKDIDWTGPLYQSANRFAHLYFFREEVGIPAWLVNMYFLDDPTLDDPSLRTTREGWRVALNQVKAELGLTGVAIPHAAELFLKGREPRELAGERGTVRNYVALAGLVAAALAALTAGAWYARRRWLP